MNKKRFFYSLPLILLLIVAVAGWCATDYLGNQARREIISEGQASALTLSIYVSSTLTTIEGAVKSLSGSPWIAPALLSKSDKDIEHANSALDRYNAALNASVSYLMDANGMTVASSNRKDPDSFVGISYRFRPYFLEAAKGQPYQYFAMGITSSKRGFYASYPVQNPQGKVIGVVTMKKDIDDMATFFRKYHFCFLISPEGIIFLSSKPEMVLKSLWPLDKTTQQKLITSQQFGNKLSEAVTSKEFADGTEVTLEGKDHFVSRKVIGSGGWSVVLLTSADRILIYKLSGIMVTIFICLLIMVFTGTLYLTERSNEAIRQSEERKRLLLYAVGDGIFGVDATGLVIFINPAALRMLGFAEEEILGKSAHALIHHSREDGSNYPVEDCPMYASYTKAVDSHVEDEVLWRKEGSYFHVDYFSTPIIKDGKVEGVVVTFRDITERKRTENYRDMSNEILQIISKSGTLHDLIQSVITAFKTRTGFDAVGIRLRDGDDFTYFAQNGFSNDFLLTENKLIERDANGGLCRDKDGKVNLECTCGLVISGKTDPSNPLFTKGGSFWTNDSVTLLDLPSDQDPRLNPRNQCIHEGYASFALMPIRNKDSIIGLIQFNDRRKNCFSLAAIEQIEGIAANIGDALLRIQAEEQIRHLATHDLLTDLPSMGLARDRLSLALDMARRYKKAVALMFVDLDGFKDVNDLLGHHAGDYVLKQVAQRLLSCVRETDTVARFGGDEFLIIATEINAPENAAQIAEKVIQLVSQPVIFNGQQVFVGTSIGIALFPEHGQDMDQLIKQADKAMYKVKNAGKNGFSFVNT